MQRNEAAEREARQVREHAGTWRRDNLALIRVTGSDAMRWLQTQTSNNVLALEDGGGQANSHLDRKGFIQGVFTVHRLEDELWILVDEGMKTRLIEKLDEHLFIEDAQLEDGARDIELAALEGPKTLRIIHSIEPEAAAEMPRKAFHLLPLYLGGVQAVAIRMGITGEDGYVFVVERGEADNLIGLFTEHGAIRPSHEAIDMLRIEAGVPKFGADFDHEQRLPETTLERNSVDFEKGCYIGQEVIAKLKTYSAPKWALMGLVSDAPMPAPGQDLLLGGKKLGAMRSSTWSPAMQRYIGMAYLDRDNRAPGTLYPFDWGEATCAALPFVEPPDPETRAHKLYEQALDAFNKDVHDQDSEAIELLTEAVLLHPTFEDAYESLGVILNRHGRVDEAIRYMQILERLNPDSIMAHTNLSVFYMTKGMIEEAEEEKAKSAVLQMAQAREARKAEELAAQERARIKAEAQERIEMFKEVIEIDPDDPLATFGMGAAYMQLQQYEEAVPYLQRATEVQKDYSAAFLNLGKCYEFLGRTGEASVTFKKGIDAANRKGDLMPMREMERRLKALQVEAEA